MGTATCSPSCTPGACSPPAETCDGRDDDCDGMVDEGFACVAGTSSSCPTSCGSSGTRSCLPSCTFDVCTPPAETCNGVDDNCNGTADEGFGCAAGSAVACTTSCGSMGTAPCSPTCTPGACSPPAETCDGRDDDCDGMVDEGFACVA